MLILYIFKDGENVNDDNVLFNTIVMDFDNEEQSESSLNEDIRVSKALQGKNLDVVCNFSEVIYYGCISK